MKKRIILCPADYSGSTEPAIDLAVDLAKAKPSKIVLLHVIEPGGNAVSIDERRVNQVQERLRAQQLDLNDIDHEEVTRHGDPAKITIEYAKRHGADLIVMGTHGRTGLSSLVTGSVAKKVMAGASCTVVTVKLPSLATVNS